MAEQGQSGEKRGRGTEALAPVLVAQQFAIDPRSPLPELDQPNARAYAVEDRRTSRGGSRPPLYALICEPSTVPRQEALRQFERIGRLPLVRPVGWGVFPWPLVNGKRFVIVLTRPAGTRVQAAPDAAFDAFSEDAVIRRVVQPLLPVLQDLKDRGLTHRGIRATNLFMTDAGGSTAVLGECVSTPPALGQPAVYEPIEPMMALASGRGKGTQADDLYALGVLVAVLLHGQDPCRQMALPELIQAKISQGTYATVVRNLRLSLPMMELLRGLLYDDPEGRWQVENLALWASGRHLSPKQPVLPARGQRPFPFDGGGYWSARALAAAMAHNWDAARDGVALRDVTIWVHRSLRREKLAETILSAVAGDGSAPSESPLLSNRRLARMLIHMDPAAPLRFQRLAVMPEALPQVLAVEFEQPGMQQLFSELVLRRLPQAWLEAQPKLTAEHTLLRRMFESLHFFVSRTGLGFGMERCLYQFNPGMPCLSPLVREEHVTDLKDLLPALEQRAVPSAIEGPPLDRHIAAFVCARADSFPERILAGLSDSASEVDKGAATAAFLAEVARRTAAEPYPRLCAWIARTLQPLVGSYHSRRLRRQLEREIELALEAGDLGSLAMAAGNSERRALDQQGFSEAGQHYAALAREIRWLEEGYLTEPAFVASRAQAAAATAATFISGAIVLVLTLMYMA